MGVIDLIEIREQESVVDSRMEEKVLGALMEQSLSKRALVRKTRYKAAVVDAIVASLAARVPPLVRVLTIKNGHGEPTVMISRVLLGDDAEARQRRLNALAKIGLLYRV